jgi:hypothetical protein
MKRWITTMTIAAATMLAGTGAASAQVLTAEIPFAFDAGNTHMQPGSYRLTASHTSSKVVLLALENLESRSAARMVAEGEADSYKRDPQAKLFFRCGSEGCALDKIWTGPFGSNVRLPEPRGGKALGSIRVVTVTVK